MPCVSKERKYETSLNLLLLCTLRNFSQLSTSALRRLTSKEHVLPLILNTHTVKGYWLFRDLVGHRFTPGLPTPGECEAPNVLTSLAGHVC